MALPACPHTREVGRRPERENILHWHDAGPWGGGWLLSLVFILILIGALVAVVVAALRRPSSSGSGGASCPSAGAEQIPAERFARGEMDEEEFERRRHVLRG